MQTLQILQKSTFHVFQTQVRMQMEMFSSNFFGIKKKHLKEKWCEYMLCVRIILHCCTPEGGLSPGIPADLEQS